MKKIRTRRATREWEDANFELQHAIVRGADEKLIEKLKAKLNAIPKFAK